MKIILFILSTCILYMPVNIYPNKKIDLIEQLHIQKDLSRLEKSIWTLIKRNQNLSNEKGLKQFHILWLKGKENLSKKDILDYSFLDKIEPMYKKKPSGIFDKKKDLRSEIFISDSIGNIVGKAYDNQTVFLNKPTISESDLIRMLYNKELDHVFRLMIGVVNSSIYMGIKDNEIYILKDSRDGIIKYKLEDFIECCFDEWMPFYTD